MGLSSNPYQFDSQYFMNSDIGRQSHMYMCHFSDATRIDPPQYCPNQAEHGTKLRLSNSQVSVFSDASTIMMANKLYERERLITHMHYLRCIQVLIVPVQ
jgi:hypothetical protein